MLWILCCLTQIITYRVKASEFECTPPSVEDICVYGNDKYFIPHGATFEFFVYDATTRSNIYYCEECWGSGIASAYLYVCTSPNTNNYYWKIGSDYQSCASWSSCYGGNVLGTNYNLDINSCLNANNWVTYNGTEWNHDIDMSLSICNPICYESDIYPQTDRQTTKTMQTKIDTSTTWNGDLYFDFSIYEEDCMNPQLSFLYELIDYEQAYEHIQIYDDNDTLIAICNGGQSCDTFDSCLIDYYIDDIIEINQTYSIMIHQTADTDNLCNDYILNAVLTLTCIPDNITTPTSTARSTVSSNQGPTSTARSTVSLNQGGKSSSVEIITTSTAIVVFSGGIILYCIYKAMKTEVIVKVDKFKADNAVRQPTFIDVILKQAQDEVDQAIKADKAAKQQQAQMMSMILLTNPQYLKASKEQQKAMRQQMINQSKSNPKAIQMAFNTKWGGTEM